VNDSRLVYKYRSFSPRALEILTSKKLYFPRPDQLNDPLDCQINIQAEYKRTESALSQRFSGEELNRKAFLLLVLNSHRFIGKQVGKRISLNEALQMWIGQRGIFSLSKTPTDALLWAHYADGHKGLCLGFDPEKMGLAGKPRMGSVEYVPAPRYTELFLSLVEEIGEFVKPWEEKHSFPDEVGDQFYTHQISRISTETLFVKSEKWKYEEEFRIVSNRSYFYSYSPEGLREIIFGSKARAADIRQVRKIIADPDWEHVKLKRVRHVAGSFDFEVVEHPDKRRRPYRRPRPSTLTPSL